MFHTYSASDKGKVGCELMALKLRYAISANGLTIAYQPVVDVRNRDVVSFEALLRWTDQTGVEVPPSVFVPLAEQTGLIADLGRWVLTEACSQAARWPNDRVIAVNVSAVQFSNSDLAADIANALRASGLPASRLEIELTETASLADKASTASILAKIRQMGVGVALDDFGTCYSSLSMVQQLPLTRLKIDRSFVRPIDMTRRSLGVARAVMELASAYELMVTAEGVETREQMCALAQIGCHDMQGYLFGKPCPIETWTERLRLTA